MVDSDALNRVSKVWIPQYDESGNRLWGGSAGQLAAMENYIKDQDGDWSRDTSLLMAIIDGSDKLQLLIPEPQLGGSGGLGITVQCVEQKDGKIEGLPETFVNYDDWQENIGGSRT